MANTIDFNVGTNAMTVLNQTADAAENTAKGFSSAKAELRALNQQLLQMDSSSEEFKKASARAAELKDNIGDLSAEINANAGNAFEGLSNNIGLFSSRLMSLDLKGAGQSLSAMGNAVGRIDFKTVKDEVGGLVKGLGNLAGAIVGNPLLALGGAVALLVLNFDKINAALSGTTEKIEKLGEANAALEKQNQILDARLIKEKALYGESFKTLELEKEKAQNNIKVAENELAIAKTTGDINLIREKENRLIETRNLLSGITAGGEADRIKGIEKAKELTIEGYKEEEDRKKAIAEFEDLRAQQLAVIAEKQRLIKANLQKEELIGTEQQYTTERANFVQKDIETKKVLVVSDRQKQLQAELNQLVEEEQILRNAKLAIATGTTVNELKAQELALQKDLNNENKTAEQLQKEIDDYNKSQQEITDILAKWEQERLDAQLKAQQDYIHANQSAQANELYDLEQKKIKELATFEGSEEDKILINETYRLLELDIEKKYDDLALQQQIEVNEKKKAADDKAVEDAKKAEEEKLAAEQAAFNARIGLVSSGLQALGALNEAFTKIGQKESKRQFQIQKSLNLASAVVDTYGGINRALNDKTMPSTTARIIQASIVGAMGLANVLKISKTEYGNASAPSGTNMSTGGGGGGTDAPSPANFAFVGNQPNQQQPPLQAYVVGTQVSSNLEAQQLIQNQSRLGG
jgi:hypothetical protein